MNMDCKVRPGTHIVRPATQ